MMITKEEQERIRETSGVDSRSPLPLIMQALNRENEQRHQEGKPLLSYGAFIICLENWQHEEKSQSAEKAKRHKK